MGRLLAIGDIHGYTVALKSLLDSVAPTESDTVVFLGDYVDKGPDVSGFFVQAQSKITTSWQLKP